ncbi:hypothetical protein ACG02S_05110 [Roseateles sp. DC23W]|uniref:Phospholipase_D-nuclease N-terminal n=1 Tax=Pelomonas dachongensis TaxID=3299029 RepID=A0ABW7EIJ5_9BURK
MTLPLLGLGLLCVLPALLCWRSVVRYDQPRVWLVEFLSMPLMGALLYLLWPMGLKSRPTHRSGWRG